jgi:tetratricopeptide (TPR) repeat protein
VSGWLSAVGGPGGGPRGSPPASLLGGVLRHGTSDAQAVAIAAAAAPVPAQLQAGVGADTAKQIQQLQRTLRADPEDVRSNDLLGLAYQQRARETGDPTYYTKSEGVLRRALRLAPNDLIATSGLGSLALSRHRFRDALALGRRAQTLSPYTARSYGVIGDALIELGRYDEAFGAFDRMSSLRPSLSSYSRVAYARELLGDVQGAAAAMRLAVESATGQPEALAWTQVQLGKLFWSQGRIRAAGREYRAALAAFPHYAYAYDGLAQVEAARGHLESSIALERRATDVIPLPQFVSALGDMERVAGHAREARKQYALVGVIRRLLVANGVKVDLETAVFDVDHRIRLDESLALARVAQRERPSIDGDDGLAWALARTGHCNEALGYSRHALRLGTLDALKFFHRGMIERCLGHSRASREWLGRALALNSNFSVLWSPVARRLAP